MCDYAYPMFAPSGYAVGEMGPGALGPGRAYADHGDGFGEYYGLDQLYNEEQNYPGRSSHVSRGHRSRKHLDSGARSQSRSESPKSHASSRSRSHSRNSRTRSKSVTPSVSREVRQFNAKPLSLLDAFRILYLTSSNDTKSKVLSTQKQRDSVQEFLKSDGLGSKKWHFYPRSQVKRSSSKETLSTKPINSCDKRIKIDATFFRKYKKNRRIAADAPIAKLKRWELSLYKKLGFIHAV